MGPLVLGIMSPPVTEGWLHSGYFALRISAAFRCLRFPVDWAFPRFTLVVHFGVFLTQKGSRLQITLHIGQVASQILLKLLLQKSMLLVVSGKELKLGC